jgi:hypothetical protein
LLIALDENPDLDKASYVSDVMHTADGPALIMDWDGMNPDGVRDTMVRIIVDELTAEQVKGEVRPLNQ